MRDTGVKVPADVFLKKGDSFDCAAIVAKLGLPLFVKPNSGGSSFGATKVVKVGDLEGAIEKAFGEDDYVLVEEYIAGRELTNGVYYCEGDGSGSGSESASGNKSADENVSGSGDVVDVSGGVSADVSGSDVESGHGSVEISVNGRGISAESLFGNKKITVLPVTEIIPEGEYFDFAAKYEGASQEICPARIPDELSARVRELSFGIFRHLDCRGFARVDYIVRGDEIYFLEINTVPGMTEMSLVPQQIRAAGMTIKEFFNDLLG
jgi:D-alanine-D-alanine ligase